MRYAQVKRVFVVEDREFIFAEGHELTVQRFYIHHYGVRKVIGDVAHLRLNHALLFIVSRRVLSGEESRCHSIEENEQRPGYQKR